MAARPEAPAPRSPEAAVRRIPAAGAEDRRTPVEEEARRIPAEGAGPQPPEADRRIPAAEVEAAHRPPVEGEAVHRSPAEEEARRFPAEAATRRPPEEGEGEARPVPTAEAGGWDCPVRAEAADCCSSGDAGSGAATGAVVRRGGALP